MACEITAKHEKRLETSASFVAHISIESEAHSELCQTSDVKSSAKIVHGF